MIYYNDFDSDVIKWLNKLSETNCINADKIDNRSIIDIKGSDIEEYNRCHFFAGIGGWELALELADWPKDKTVWTGSCPCQPFSTAGKQKGTEDERHLWPEFKRLIKECKPTTIFGEQVSSKLGRKWLSGVFSDLEEMGYAVAGADLCSAGVSSPHIRQRLYWVADSEYMSKGARKSDEQKESSEDGGSRPTDSSSKSDGLVNTIDKRLERYDRNVSDGDKSRRKQENESRPAGTTMWDDYDVVRCVEPTKEEGRFVEKWRRVKSGTLPLALRFPKGVGLSSKAMLRGYGNSISPQVAANFIKSFMEIKNG